MAAETIRIEIPIEALDKTEPSLSQVIRNFGKMEAAADQAGAASQRAGGVGCPNLTVLLKGPNALFLNG